MYFYKMEHRGGFKEAAESAVRISSREFILSLDFYRFYSKDDRLGEFSIRFMFRGGPLDAYLTSNPLWLIACSLPKSKWSF